jgi:predicted acyl esterase
MTRERVDNIEVIFRNAKRPEEWPAYQPLNERTYVLPKGHLEREGAMPSTCELLVEQDVPVRMRDGVTIRVDIYRPVEGRSCPAIMGWGPYGKRGSVISIEVLGHPTRMDVPLAWEDGLNVFEGPNPAYWVAHGYAVIAPDPRGVFNSEGDLWGWGYQEAEDEYDLIEWIGTREWSNGKVGLTGNSWLAISQWFVASLRPPHLAAIAPWEGSDDQYRDDLYRGGIPGFAFAESIISTLHGKGRQEDFAAMAPVYPLFNEYWQTKAANHQKTEVPAYIVASWTNFLHTHGTLQGWRNISSKEKWLRVHHTHEWNDYYNPVNVEDLRRFFDYFLKGKDNGWQDTPRVRLTVLDPGNEHTLNRPEQDFPLARQKLVPFYLSDAAEGGCLSRSPVAGEATIVYDVTDRRGASFRITFNEDTELTGYMNLKLWVEAHGNDDMDLYVVVRKIDRHGVEQQPPMVTGWPHIGPNGRLRVSLRATDPDRSTEYEPFLPFTRQEKLKPGEIVPVEIGLWPYSMRWRAGETLELVISGIDPFAPPEAGGSFFGSSAINLSKHALHVGGKFDAHLLVPVID